MSETENLMIIQKRWRFFRPGPPLALLLFAQALTGAVLTDLIVYRTCLISLNISHTKCNLLRTNVSSAEAQELQTEVDPHASMIIMAKSLVDSILPSLLSLFLGPWSDRRGRKPLFVAGVTGFAIMYTLLAVMCNWNINPWYLLMPSIAAAMMGGLSSVVFASICYVSDTTAEEERTMSLTWIQASISSGLLVGILTGPALYKSYGFSIVFVTAAIGCILALLYTYFCIRETVEDASKESISGLFKTSFVRELIASCWVERDGFNRPVVWLAISFVTIWVVVLQGEASIEYLFTSKRLGWDVQHYGDVSGANMIMSTIGVVGGVSLLSRVLGCSDLFITSIGLMSGLACAITKSLISQDWHMYLAVGLGMFTGIIGPVNRSTMSKCVPPQDQGKVFALTMSLEALTPLAAAPLYTLVFSHYLPPIYPAPVYLVSTGLFILLILNIAWTEVLLRKSPSSGYVSLISNE